MGKHGRFKSILAVTVGVFLGASFFTFWYANGFTYLSSDPKACSNCHIMRDNFNSWQLSSHHTVACNDCHLPHDFIGKYMAKGMNGYHHSWAFTFGAPDVLRIKHGNSVILNNNCIRCHKDIVDHTMLLDELNRQCTDCHREVGHGR